MINAMQNEIRQELRKFAETTGIKGIGRIVKTPSRVIRFFWLSSISGCLSILLFQIESVLSNYTHHTVTRSSKVVQAKPIFPEVTICNLFPVDNFTSADYDEYTKAIDIMSRYDSELNITTFPGLWTNMKSLIFYNANVPLPEETSGSDDGFVVECLQYGWDLYQAVPCKSKTVMSALLQKCHRIELNWTNGTVAAVTLLLFTDSFQSQVIDGYNSWIRVLSGTGARVMIHPNGTFANPRTAIVVSTGNQLNIQLKQTNVNRLPQPYGNCTDRKLLIRSQPDSPSYSYVACVSLCRQQQKAKRCGCLDNSEYFTDEEFSLANHTFCVNMTPAVSETPIQKETVASRLKLIQCQISFLPNEGFCDCPVPCSETYYDTITSSSQWPNPLYHLSFYKQYIQGKELYGSKFSAYEEVLKSAENQTEEETVQQIKGLRLIEDNFLELQIMFSEENFQEFTDSAAVTWDTLVANLGGSFNLWLGICVPTFVEIIELIYSLLAIVCCNRKSNAIDQGVSGRKQ